MQSEHIIDTAYAAVLDAYQRDQPYAIPHILAGYSTAMLQTAMMTRVLRYVDCPLVQPGDYVTRSPTKIERVSKAGEVESLKIVSRPAISLTAPPTREKIESICTSILTAADRLFYNLLRQQPHSVPADGLEGLLALGIMQKRAANCFAFVGNAVSHSFVGQLAHNIARDTGDKYSTVLLDDEVIVATPGSDVLGFYSVKPVQVGLVGYPDEKLPAVNLVTNDSKFEASDPMYSRVEFNMITKLAIVLHSPDSFLFIHGAPRG